MDLLSANMRGEMLEELEYSDGYISRIIFLKGEPELTLQKTPVRAGALK